MSRRPRIRSKGKARAVAGGCPHPPPESSGKADRGLRRISLSGLLAFYLIVPVCLAVQLADAWLWNGHLRTCLPITPESYFILSLLFGTPHIIASNIIFLTNQEYLRSYAAGAAWVTLGIIAFFALGTRYLTYNILFAVVATATIVHVVKQQIGIGNMAAKCSGALHQVWMWTLIGSSVLMYNGIFLQRALAPGLLQGIDAALAASALVLVATALRLQTRAQSRTGRGFIWANTLMLLASFYFYWEHYPFFAMLGPRLVHDGTAFVFYIIHDHNRHHPEPRNWLYAAFRKARLNAVIAVPATAILATLFLQQYADLYFGRLTQALLEVKFEGAIAFGFVGYLGLMHYYMEAITWKRASPYRRYVSIVP